jgi:hypothetical protein
LKFYRVFNHELKTVINKNKEKQFIISKESEIEDEYEEKLNLFLSELYEIIKEKKMNLRETVVVYFEVFFRLKRDIPKDISDMIFEQCRNSENLKNSHFTKMDLIKLSFILSRYNTLLSKRQNAVEGLSNVVNSFIEIGLGNFQKEELLSIIKNLSYKNVYLDLEFFTRLEPYLLKHLNEYKISSIVNIFCIYIKNFIGSDFFLQTLGFSISKNLEFLTSKDLVYILDTSHKRYYNREEISFNFLELFKNIFDFLLPKLNEFKSYDIQAILIAMLNISYNDKKFLNLLSTVYLKFSEKEEFRNFVNIVYYFTVCDLENDVFYAKTLETFKFNLLCLKNYILGNDSMDNLIGLYDKNLINILNNKYFDNISRIKDKLRYFERIEFDSEEIFTCLDMLSKTVWNISFILHKVTNKITQGEKIKLENFSELIRDAIEIFNILVSNLSKCAGNGTEVKIINANVKKFLLSYIFLSRLSQNFKIKQNLNLDFLKGKNLNFQDHNYEYKELSKFYKFKRAVLNVISSKELNFEETLTGKFSMREDNLFVEFNPSYFEQIENFDVVDFVQAHMKRTNNSKDKIKTEIILINDPYDYFENTMNESGYNKFRKHLCTLLKLEPIHIDYNEFLTFFKDIQINEENLEDLIREFLVFKIG